MANDLQSYRATIGLFNCYYPKSNRFRITIANPIIIMFLKLGIRVFSNANLAICFLTVYLLLLCGDIEQNPGPQKVNKMTLVNYNVCGLKNKLDHVTANLSENDIIAITESHLTNLVENSEIIIPGFQPPFRCDRDRGWGGVCVYISDYIAASRRRDFEDPELEMVCLEIHDAPKTILIVLYRPPNLPVDKWQNISDTFEKVLDTLPDATIIITGDLNDDLLKHSSYFLKNIILSHGLSQLIQEPTRPISGSLLDPIITNKFKLVENSGV